MKRRIFIYVITTLVFMLGSVGCVKESYTGTLNDGKTGSIRIQVAIHPETKAPLESPVDKSIQTLSVWLVQGTEIVDRSITEPKSESVTVEFNEVSRGDYTLYLVANYTGLNGDAYKVGKTIDAAFLNTSLGPIKDQESPSYADTEGIPCSLVTQVSVTPGVNNVTAHLIRAVGRMSITFRNAVNNYDLYIGDVILTKRNQNKGFLFGKGDHSLPSGTVANDFPDLGPMVKIEESSSAKVFDHYLFETSTNVILPFSLSFAAGLYPKGTPETDVNYTIGNVNYRNVDIGNNTNSIEGTDKTYLIRSASSTTKYVGINDNSLILGTFEKDDLIKSLSSDELKKYLWTFSATSDKYTIQNVFDQTKYITLNKTTADLDAPGSELDINQSGNYIHFSYSTGSWYNKTTYYFAANTGYTSLLGTTSTTNLRNWYLREVEVETFSGLIGKFSGADKDITTENSYTITYIDKYGAPIPLQHICRNEYVDIVVNIRYNVELGEFQFEVEPWGSVQNETTFD